MREFTIKGWNGEPVQVWVTYPPDFDPREEVAADAHDPRRAARRAPRRLALSLEHARVRRAGLRRGGVNYHGSSGFGQKFIETITGQYGKKEFADTEAATDYLLRRGYIDRKRLTATGGSYGGYMVAYMNGHTDRYSSYVCHAGCYDWVSDDGDRRLPLLRQASSARSTGTTMPRVMSQSPHHFVKRARRRRW